MPTASILHPPTPPVTARTGSIVNPPLATPTLAGDESAAVRLATPMPTEVSATVAPAATLTAILPSDGRFTVGAAPGVPAALVTAARRVADNNPEAFAWIETVPDNVDPDVFLTVNDGRPLAEWVYALAAPFATVADGTSWPVVTSGWRDGASDLGRLLVDAETATALAAVWGPSQSVTVLHDDFIGQVWAARPSWTILPFERLRPEFKVLALDGRSPLTHDFSTAGYPLLVPITLKGNDEAVSTFTALWDGPSTNRDPARLTRVAMSGVTALVRATAAQMELRGILWPGEEVAPVLQGADITHLSNEVSFAADCPYPDAYGGTTFCSRDAYFDLIKHLGTDVIEQTGNHLNDYGREPLVRSLDMYANAGMQWFGGGRDLADATRPAIFEHNGNRIAFVGCNPVGPAGDWALDNAAGSRPCGPDLTAQITQLRDAGHVVIATLQYIEHYLYDAPPDQQAAFSELAAAGASAVSGSQAHHVQGFAFENGAYVHYGLGNLFFDQMDMMGTRQTFVDTYTVYDGRLLSIELWTGLIEDWARPRLMTPDERRELLETVYQASGW